MTTSDTKAKLAAYLLVASDVTTVKALTEVLAGFLMGVTAGVVKPEWAALLLAELDIDHTGTISVDAMESLVQTVPESGIGEAVKQ